MESRFSWLSILASVALVIAVFVYFPDDFEPESIRGKRVLITGASSGIGEGLAYYYSQLGASVIVTARRRHLLEAVSERCRQLGAERVEYVVADMANADDRERLVVQVQKSFGGLDHLILNHAIASFAWWTGSAENMTTLRRFMEVNFVSFVDIASRSLPMLTASKGNIGVVSSVGGKMAFPLVASYSSNKFALHGFFTALRQELLAREVDVSITLIVIGYVDTDMARAGLEAMQSPVGDSNYLFGPASVNETAPVIVRGVANRAYEITYRKSFLIAIFLHKLAPEFFEKYVTSQVAKHSTVQ